MTQATLPQRRRAGRLSVSSVGAVAAPMTSLASAAEAEAASSAAVGRELSCCLGGLLEFPPCARGQLVLRVVSRLIGCSFAVWLL